MAGVVMIAPLLIHASESNTSQQGEEATTIKNTAAPLTYYLSPEMRRKKELTRKQKEDNLEFQERVNKSREIHWPKKFNEKV